MLKKRRQLPAMEGYALEFSVSGESLAEIKACLLFLARNPHRLDGREWMVGARFSPSPLVGEGRGEGCLTRDFLQNE